MSLIQHKNKIIIHLIIMIFFYQTINSQDLFREFKNITVREGLPHGTVNCILQDYIGYIWVATDGGLAKFNSHKFTLYKQILKDSTSISANQIFSIYEDNKKNLWIGSKLSLELYNRELDNFKSFYFVNVHDDLVEKVPVLDIMQYSDSLYLIGTDGGGVYLFNPYQNKYRQYKKNTKGNIEINVQRVSKIIKDGSGKIWLATLDAGFIRFDINTGNLEPIGQSNFKEKEIRFLALDDKNQIYIGTYGDGLWIYDIKSTNLKKSILSMGSYSKLTSRIFSIFIDKNTDNIIVGTDGGGLIEYNQTINQIYHYEHLGFNPYSISNNVIKSILIDSENNLWTGHFLAGISFSAKKNPFHNVRYNPAMENSLSNSLVSSILSDNYKNIWIGTDGGGLNILSANGYLFNSFSKGNEIISQINSKSILSLYKAGNTIWIGTYLEGVYQYSEKTGKILHFGSTKSGHHLTNDDIRCFFEDRSGRMWIGTNGGGINIYDPVTDKIEIIKRDDRNLENTLSLDWVRCIIADSYGFIWIGTAYGLNIYDPVTKNFNKFIHIPHDTTSLSDDFIYSIFEDSNKDIWIGTAYGLNKYNRLENKFATYLSDNGLPDNIIYGIQEDTKKNLWISTNNGLSKYSINDNYFSNFDVDDGLLSNSFINGAIFKTSENVIYLGSISGLTFFNPEEINYSIDKAPLEITDFKIFNQSVKIGDSYNENEILKKDISLTSNIEISHKENVIAFEYTALNFSNPKKIKYSYKLENFDKKWMTDENNLYSVAYTDLRPGDYIFRVKTINLAENIERQIKITVTPPFYQTIWFKIIAAFIIVAAIYYWNHNRIYKIKNQKEALERKMIEENLRHEKEQINLRNENLRSEMGFKNAQLTSYTLMITHKNDIMKEIKAKLIDFIKGIKSENTDGSISELIKAIDIEFKVEEDWERFEEHFNQIHKDFLIRLKEKYPDLSSTFLKLCAYLKMNLSSKEIASLMNISNRGVEKSRSRLRKKFNLSETDNLISFISNF